MSSSSSSVQSDFHQNVHFLQNLLLEAGRHEAVDGAPNRHPAHSQSSNKHKNNNNSGSSHAIRNYNIRRCLRHIQGLLLSREDDHFDLPELLVASTTISSSTDGGVQGMDFCHGNGSGSSSSDSQASAGAAGRDGQSSRHDNMIVDDHQGGLGLDESSKTTTTYSQVTDDLMTLLTMDFEVVGDDPSIFQLVREVLIPRVIALLETAPTLTPPQLHALLHRLLFLLEHAAGDDGSSDTRSPPTTTPDQHDDEQPKNNTDDAVRLSLIELFNRHVTNHEHLHSVLHSDQELFVALHIALHYHHQHRCRHEQVLVLRNNKNHTGRRRHQQSVLQALPPPPPPLALAILINSLIEYWTFHCLTSSLSPSRGGERINSDDGLNNGNAMENDSDANHHNEEDGEDDRKKDLHTWLQCRFLQQQGQTFEQSPDMLRCQVDGYVAIVDRYGTELIESTVRLLEEASASASASASESSSQPATSGTARLVAAGSISATDNFCSNNNHQDEEDYGDVTILKYAMLATSFLAAMYQTTFSFCRIGGTTSAAFAMSRSLWQEYINFLVHRLSSKTGMAPTSDGSAGAGRMMLEETCETSLTIRNATSIAATTTAIRLNAAAEAEEEEQEMQLAVAATDTLWRLAQLHYPAIRANTSSSTSRRHGRGGSTCKNSKDISLIVATILQLWKHATAYWNDSTVDWIQWLLQECFPTSSSAGKDLRHSLQAVILSYIHFPTIPRNHYRLAGDGGDCYYPKEPVETIIELVFQDHESAEGDKGVDPWTGWFLEQLSSNDMGHFMTTSSDSNAV